MAFSEGRIIKLVDVANKSSCGYIIRDSLKLKKVYKFIGGIIIIKLLPASKE